MFGVVQFNAVSLRPHFAGVVELVDTLDLGSSALGRVGSSPSTRTYFVPDAYMEEPLRLFLSLGLFLSRYSLSIFAYASLS